MLGVMRRSCAISTRRTAAKGSALREPREHLARVIQWLCPRPAVFVLLTLPGGEAKGLPYLCFFREEETYLLLCLFSCQVDLKNY